MQRYVRIVADHPAVMPRRDVEDISRLHLDHAAIFHGSSCGPGDHHSHVLNFTDCRAGCRANINGPFPSWLIRSAPDGHATDVDQLKFSLRKVAGFIRMIEAFENDVEHK